MRSGASRQGRSAEQGVQALELGRYSGAEQAVGRPQSSQTGPEGDFRVNKLGGKLNHTGANCSAENSGEEHSGPRGQHALVTWQP